MLEVCILNQPQFLQTAATCWSNDRDLSRTTPRLFKVDDGVITEPETEIVSTLVGVSCWRLGLKTIASDLVGFRQSELWSSHIMCTALRQYSNSDSLLTKFVLLTAIYIWVSSAYCWWFKSNWRMTADNGAMYSVKSMGPSDEPWGTPTSTAETAESDEWVTRIKIWPYPI